MSANSSLSLVGSVSPLEAFPIDDTLRLFKPQLEVGSYCEYCVVCNISDEISSQNADNLMMVLVDKRKEMLRLYREILRTSRMFPHRTEQGQLWSSVLQNNSRLEIEQNRYETVRGQRRSQPHPNITVKN